MEAVIHAQRDMNQMSTWLTATKLASLVKGIPLKVETTARNAQCIPNLKVATATAAQITVMIIRSFYHQVIVRNVMRVQSQISFGEESALLIKEIRFVMEDKLSSWTMLV